MIKTCIDKHLPPAPGYRAIGVKGKFWKSGDTITIGFIGGTVQQREFVKKVSVKWLQYVSLKFEWDAAGPDRNLPEVRISFDEHDGSWSYIGTDCLGIPADKPTMNLGWLDDAVVLHEFGHMLGLGHEQQNPSGGIQWNAAAVKNDLSRPPNSWDDATIFHNVLEKYSFDQIIGTELDPASIMMYFFPSSWTRNNLSMPVNTAISAKDAAFIATVYPKAPDNNLSFRDGLKACFNGSQDLYTISRDTLVRIAEKFGLFNIKDRTKKQIASDIWGELNNQ